MKDSKPVSLPQVFLPYPDRVTDAESSLNLFTVLARTTKLFNRGGKPVTIKPDNLGGVSIEVLTQHEAVIFFSRYVRFMGYRSGANNELVEKGARCTPDQAKMFLADSVGLELLPKLEGVNGLPILRRGKDGALFVTPAGYDKVSGLYIVKGLAAGEDPSLSHAVQIWVGMFRDFKFLTPGAKSRAAMGLLTHIAKVGGIFSGQAPLLFIEANSPQTGKSYLTKMAAALMGGAMTTITDQGKGVGGLGEAVANALFEGKPLILLDNCRGKIDSVTLESAMTTEGTFQVRLHQKGYRNISTEKVSFLATSNAAEVTPDLAARSSMVQLLHQPEGYEHTKYASGRETKEEIKANPSYFLRAAFVILKEWYRRGCLSTGEKRHEFREWAGKFDWIGQYICGLAPLMDDHQAAQKRTSNPAETWARVVMQEVVKSNELEKWMQALRIGELCQDAGIDIPGLKDNDGNLAGAKAVGSNMLKLFGRDEGKTVVEIEGGTITRKRVYEARGDGRGDRELWVYMFEVVVPVVTAPKVADVVPSPARSIVPAPSVVAPVERVPAGGRFDDAMVEAMKDKTPGTREKEPVAAVAVLDPVVVIFDQAKVNDWDNPTSDVRMLELKNYLPPFGVESVRVIADLLGRLSDRKPSEVRLTIDEGLRRGWWCSSRVPDPRNPTAEPKEFLSFPPQTIKPREAHHEHQAAEG